MSPRLATLALLALAPACRTGTEVAYVSGWDWQWSLFNHRLSVLRVMPHADGVEVGVVGGASTTGTVFDDGGDCVNPDTCWELPVLDSSDLLAQRTDVTADRVLLTRATLTLDTSAGGTTATAELVLPGRGRRGDTVAAWIGGLSLDSGIPVGDDPPQPSCYDARHGWLPRTLSLSVGDAALSADRRTVLVPVTAAMAAGPSRETQRECLDAALPVAAYRVSVEVVVAVGEVEVDAMPVTQGAAWADGKADQPLADVGDVAAALDPAAASGWTDLSFTFHETEDAGRGAYLRQLATWLDADAGEAYGYATNKSGTALSGFDYAFTGTVQQVSGELEVTRTTYGVDDLPAALGDGGEPAWTVLGDDAAR